MIRFLFIMCLLFILIIPSAWAGTVSQCPGINCENVFNKVTDSVATLGKNPTAAQRIKYQRRRTRRLARQRSINQANQAKNRAWAERQNNL